MTDVYVLKLANGNYYVGKTDRGEKRLKEHVAGRGAEWTKLHKPKEIHAYYRNYGDSGEKKVFNQMVKKYGAKKVRGAHFTKRKASPAELKKMNERVGLKKRTTRRKTTTRKAPPKKTTKRKTTTRKAPGKKTTKRKTTTRKAPGKKTTKRTKTSSKKNYRKPVKSYRKPVKSIKKSSPRKTNRRPSSRRRY